MARLYIIYDTREQPLIMSNGDHLVTTAQIPVKDGLANNDLYTLARKLAEMFLEQLPPKEEEIKF